MSLFERQRTITFRGPYWKAEQRRDLFEAMCWDAGVVPIRWPDSEEDIQNGVLLLSNGYRFSDLAGADTETALAFGNAEADRYEALVYLGLI